MLEELFKSIADAGGRLVWETPAAFPWLVALLLSSGIYITFRMRWINATKLGHAFKIVMGKYDNPADGGDINHFQALTTALSATVGVGNIAGVATAVHYGGPGVVFWLWVSGIFGMTLKFAECTLSLHFRTFDAHGRASGGPMYSIERGMGGRWKWMAVLFAVLAVICSFATGNMNQANTVAVSLASEFQVPGHLVGLVLAATAGMVIIGGIRRIGAVSSRLMPAMAVLYTLGALVILLSQPLELPGIFATIVREAFSPSAAIGGAAVGVWNLTLLWGIKRALFSNEAGQGSAPIAHAAAKTKEPVREGIVAMVGPLVDTLMICTLTGFVIVGTGVWDKKFPMELPLEVNKIQILAAPPGPVTDRDLHREGGPKFVPFVNTAAVVEGKAPGLLFLTNDGFLEEARLLQDSRPYTGPLTVTAAGLRDGEGRALALRITGRGLQNSSALTALAFQEGFEKAFGLGALGRFIVTISVCLFAISTIISWSYYGDRCVEYLFGVAYIKYYHIAYIGFTYLGAVLALETVWAFGDLALGVMSVPNLISVLLLSPVLGRMTRDYFSREHRTYAKAARPRA